MRSLLFGAALGALCCIAGVSADAGQRPFSAQADALRRYGAVPGGAIAGSATPDAPFEDLVRIEVPSSADAARRAGERTIADVIAAQGGRHVVLTHPDFPQISIRIKQLGLKTKSVSEMRDAPDASALFNNSDPKAFCDPTVTSWSGYVDTIDGKSLFFYFFESRDDPEKDPVLMWLTGGPGCSSSLGLLMELGPCYVPENGGRLREGPPINGTKWNPYSWNSHANIFFLDQPVDVGYSYSRYGVHTYDADNGAKDVYAFLRVFYSAFSKFLKNDFVITGESYAGRYIPRYASEIVDRNYEIAFKAEKAGKKLDKSHLINLKKIAIGNGLTDHALQVPEYYDFTCTRRGGHEPVLSIETCKRLATWKQRCTKWLKEVCRDTYDSDRCETASDKCASEFEAAYAETGRNPYNVADLCRAGLEPNLCYDVTADIRNYLNRADVRKLVGAEPASTIGKFESCNMNVNSGFTRSNDMNVNNADYVAGLLERGLEILIYVGKLDWICNHLGNKKWVDVLSWTDAEAFHSNKLKSWHVDSDEPAGMTQSGGGLTWATVEGAGHMVPYDKPAEALALLTRWLNGDAL